MNQVSLADITYEQGLSLLFLRKQAIDEGKLSPLAEAEKGGFDLDSLKQMASSGYQSAKSSFKPMFDEVSKALKPKPDYSISGMLKRVQSNPYVANIGKTLEANPNLKRSLMFAGTGAGVGALTDLASSSKGNRLRNMLIGGLSGGALGGGLGALSSADSISSKVKGSDVVPTADQTDRLSSYEKNRLPFFNPTVENVAAYAPGAGLTAGGLYSGNKLVSSTGDLVDPDKLSSGLKNLIELGVPNTGRGKSNFKPNVGKLSEFLNVSNVPLANIAKKYNISHYSDLADLISKLSPEQAKDFFKSQGLLDINPSFFSKSKGLPGVASRINTAFGQSGADDVAKGIFETAKVKPTIKGLAKGTGGRGKALLALLSLLATGTGVASLGKNLVTQSINEVNFRNLANKLEKLKQQ